MTKLNWTKINLPFYHKDFDSSEWQLKHRNEYIKLKESIRYKDSQNIANELFHKLTKAKQKSKQWPQLEKSNRNNIVNYVQQNPNCHDEIKNIAKLQVDYSNSLIEAQKEIDNLNELVKNSEVLNQISLEREEQKNKWNKEHPSFQSLYDEDITINSINLFQIKHKANFIVFIKVIEHNELTIKQLGKDIDENGSDLHPEEPEFLRNALVTEIGVLEL